MFCTIWAGPFNGGCFYITFIQTLKTKWGGDKQEFTKAVVQHVILELFRKIPHLHTWVILDRLPDIVYVYLLSFLQGADPNRITRFWKEATFVFDLQLDQPFYVFGIWVKSFLIYRFRLCLHLGLIQKAQTDRKWYIKLWTLLFLSCRVTLKNIYFTFTF